MRGKYFGTMANMALPYEVVDETYVAHMNYEFHLQKIVLECLNKLLIAPCTFCFTICCWQQEGEPGTVPTILDAESIN